MMNTREQGTFLHAWIISGIGKQHLVQIGRIDGSTEYVSSILTAINSIQARQFGVFGYLSGRKLTGVCRKPNVST